MTTSNVLVLQETPVKAAKPQFIAKGAKALKLTEDDAIRLVGIGFCQPSFYKRHVWLKAKKLMDNLVCPNELAFPHNFGHGKGKYESNFDIDEVKERTVELLRNEGNLIEEEEKTLKLVIV
tara:strand:- start:636 stop:998 length:363 start_codon:yes stop_codon:yes gene_type:complete